MVLMGDVFGIVDCCQGVPQYIRVTDFPVLLSVFAHNAPFELIDVGGEMHKIGIGLISSNDLVNEWIVKWAAVREGEDQTWECGLSRHLEDEQVNALAQLQQI